MSNRNCVCGSLSAVCTLMSRTMWILFNNHGLVGVQASGGYRNVWSTNRIVIIQFVSVSEWRGWREVSSLGILDGPNVQSRIGVWLRISR